MSRTEALELIDSLKYKINDQKILFNLIWLRGIIEYLSDDQWDLAVEAAGNVLGW